MNKIREQADTKRWLSRQGLLLTAWDEHNPILIIDLPSPLALWTISENIKSNLTISKSLEPRSRTATRSKRIHHFKAKLPNEIVIYTDASVATSNIGVAWICPENTSVQDQLSLKHYCATALEGELHAINGALNRICYELNSRPPAKIRILTDSFEAIDERWKQISLNPLGTSTLLHKPVLQIQNVHIRIDCIPGNQHSGPRNHSAHEAAQECLNFTPLLALFSASSPTSTALLLLQLKKRKKTT